MIELRISSLNTSKTSFASFVFSDTSFFDKFAFSSSNSPNRLSWSCKLQNRALLSIFKRRQTVDQSKENAVERVELQLRESPDITECRIVIKLFCRFNVVKTFRLTYETAEALNATFDRANSKNSWTLPARTLRDVGEYFGPRSEHVNWSLSDDNKVIFTSYTEKVQAGNEIIRQPVHTSVTLSTQDFEKCTIEPGVHVSIPVKDFRSIVAHADAIRAEVTATFSQGARPMQVTYQHGGLTATFTLMTRGTSAAVVNQNQRTIATPARLASAPREPSQPNSRTTLTTNDDTGVDVTTPNINPNKQWGLRQEDSTTTATRPKLPVDVSVDTSAPSASINPESMFIPADDDDQQWDPQTYDAEEDAGRVVWDASAVGSAAVGTREARQDVTDTDTFISAFDARSRLEIQPTQRLSQIKGIFD